VPPHPTENKLNRRIHQYSVNNFNKPKTLSPITYTYTAATKYLKQLKQIDNQHRTYKEGYKGTLAFQTAEGVGN
jgi:hypothetical protein